MASITVNVVNKGRTKAAIAEKAARTAELTAMYNTLAKAIKVAPAVIVEEDDVSAQLVVKTDNAKIQVQITHPTEVLRLTEDLGEWLIMSGDFSLDTQAEEWFPEDTKPAVIAKRIDAMVRELNAVPATEDAPKPKRAIARKPKAVDPEPVEVEVPQRTRKLPSRTK